MVKKVILILCLVFAAQSFAQKAVSVHLGQVYTKFRYSDSNGAVDDNLIFDIRYAYGVNYSQFVSKFIALNAELGYKNWGSSSLDENHDVLRWDLHYLNFNTGINYYFSESRLRPYLGLSFFAGYMYKADQTIGISKYDLRRDKTLKDFDLGIQGKVGLTYLFSDATHLFMDVRYSHGMMQLETAEGQNLFNTALSINLGLAFKIDNKIDHTKN